MIPYILDPLRTVGHMVLGILPTIVGVLAVLVIGSLLARTLGKIIADAIKRVQIDKLSHAIGLTDTLEKGGIKHPISDLAGTITTWVLMVTTFVIAMKMVGITVIGEATDYVLGYVPGLVSGIVVLTVAMVLAYIVAAFIRVVAANTDMPRPELMATYTKWAIVATGFIAFVNKVGLGFLFTGTPFYMIVGALALALGLAFGLGGRDRASHYLDKLFK